LSFLAEILPMSAALPEIVYCGVAQGKQERVEWQTLEITASCSSQSLMAQTEKLDND
jgi:hypothetical protein